MEILLMADVPDVGTEGQVVTVADGFARNYLVPRKLGAPVTNASRARLAKLQKQREAENKAAEERTRFLAEKLAGVSCTIAAKTSEAERLYGSVTAAEIAENLKGQGFDIARDAVLLEEPIKALGVYTVKVRLSADVSVPLKVWVVEE
jgi:large subunit ribosomal protein L9